MVQSRHFDFQKFLPHMYLDAKELLFQAFATEPLTLYFKPSEENFKNHLDSILTEAIRLNLSWAAFCDAKLVGIALVSPLQRSSPETPMLAMRPLLEYLDFFSQQIPFTVPQGVLIDMVAVNKSEQGFGVAQRLIEKVCTEAEALGIGSLCALATSETSLRALTKNGFNLCPKDQAFNPETLPRHPSAPHIFPVQKLLFAGQDQCNFQTSLPLMSDWIQEYSENKHQFPVLSGVKPGETYASLDKALQNTPAVPLSMKEILAEIDNLVIPGLTHWQHPRFMGFFPANTSPPAMLAEMMIATLNIQNMNWISSPAATELELCIMKHLAKAFDLFTSQGQTFAGCTQETASNALLSSLVAARSQVIKKQPKQTSIAQILPKLVVYASEQTHSSLDKALLILGLENHQLRRIATNESLSIEPRFLRSEIEKDLKLGFVPLAVISTFGSTGCGACDLIDENAQICEEFDIWHHVDGAYGGSAWLLPEVRSLAKGLERADSIVINAHKWLFGGFECTLHFFKNPSAFRQALEVLPEYLKNTPSSTTEHPQALALKDFGTGLGRRFRALKLWILWRWYSKDQLMEKLRTHLRLAEVLFDKLILHPHIEMVFPNVKPLQNNTWKLPMAMFCLRVLPEAARSKRTFNKKQSQEFDARADALTHKLLTRCNASGIVFLTHTRLPLQPQTAERSHAFVIRVVVASAQVNLLDVNIVADCMITELTQILANVSPKVSQAETNEKLN